MPKGIVEAVAARPGDVRWAVVEALRSSSNLLKEFLEAVGRRMGDTASNHRSSLSRKTVDAAAVPLKDHTINWQLSILTVGRSVVATTIIVIACFCFCRSTKGPRIEQHIQGKCLCCVKKQTVSKVYIFVIIHGTDQ